MQKTSQLSTVQLLMAAHKEIETIEKHMRNAASARDFETSLHYVQAAEGRAKVLVKNFRTLKFKTKNEVDLEKKIKGIS